MTGDRDGIFLAVSYFYNGWQPNSDEKSVMPSLASQRGRGINMQEMTFMKSTKLAAIALLLALYLSGCRTLEVPASVEYLEPVEPATPVNTYPNYERNYILGTDFFLYEDVGQFMLPTKSETYKYGIEDYPKFKELYYPLVAFYDERFQPYCEYECAIPHLATSKYMSIEVKFASYNDVANSVYTSVTIDLETMTEVFLNDLVVVDDNFIQLLMEGDVVKSDVDDESLDFLIYAKDFSNHTYEGMKVIIESCSVHLTGENTDKAFFFLSPGRLYFCCTETYQPYRKYYLYVRLDDIADFLKVDRW